jgi:hypothetical protein
LQRAGWEGLGASQAVGEEHHLGGLLERDDQVRGGRLVAAEGKQAVVGQQHGAGVGVRSQRVGDVGDRLA